MRDFDEKLSELRSDLRSIALDHTRPGFERNTGVPQAEKQVLRGFPVKDSYCLSASTLLGSCGGGPEIRLNVQRFVGIAANQSSSAL
ncbi:hypothetical protein [Paraburkholderia sp. J63]|uniref:hypothetical protein n=1 Tax=Paraburkholderia sp. J63 TaxID=2805434 RepID=UPI002ABE4230|nr:hypothetical protein [Paraburkholderia sp. J63]